MTDASASAFDRTGPGAVATAAPPDRHDSSSAARKALLGRLHLEDAVTAVARRLRTAIGLGVLTDGERLPREADLARQLGVTVFSLREALCLLRQEGLIRTRVGKNGGSYIEQPPDGETMARNELERLSGAELRDLGDWRATLTASSARLAALRGDGTADRLDACVEEMLATTSAGAARRALGRFHVELASGAQSMRLTRAELVMHEEFDWLVQALLRHERRRRSLARNMGTVADQVRAGASSAARESAEQLVADLVTDLARMRLHLLAARHSGSHQVLDPYVDGLAGALRAALSPTITLLENLGEQLQTALPLRPTADGLTVAVAHAVLPNVSTVDSLVHGLGFMAEVGLTDETPYWLEWWQRSVDQTFDREYGHQLDPRRDDFYDYSTKSYMTLPRTTGEVVAVGPYVDHGGVDDYVVTVSVPVRRHDSFLGIMAADIRVANLERRLSPWLARADGTCVVLNAASRVLLSSSVRYSVGDVVPHNHDMQLSTVGRFGWTVASAPSEPDRRWPG